MVEINSGASKLSLEPKDGDYLQVSFVSDGVLANVTSYLYKDAQDLILFFQDIASTWKGWEGIKMWQSVEGDICFDAIHDAVGYVILNVKMTKQDGFAMGWALNGQIKVELGSLERIAAQVKDTLS